MACHKFLVWMWSPWLISSKSMGCQRCLCRICPPSRSACLGHVDVKYTGFLEKDGIFATSEMSGHPRSESVHSFPLMLRCCWQRNRKRSVEVISELHLKCRTAVPEKAEKVYGFDEGSGCVCAFFPIWGGSSLGAGVILLLSCTTNYTYGVCYFGM